MVRNFLAWMAWHAATRAMTSFTFYQGTCKPKGIGYYLRPSKTQLIGK